MDQTWGGGEDAPRLLLVDDDPGAMRLLELACRELDPPVETLVARDGGEALDVLHGRGDHADGPRPDVVILDLDLPRVGGRDVLREIRTTEALSAMPVVVLSQNDDEETIEECYRLGANAYVVKPRDYEGLLQAVETVSTFWSASQTELPSNH